MVSFSFLKGGIKMLSIEKTMELHKELWTRIAELITKKDQTRNLFITDLKERALRPILEREGSEILPINYCFFV